MYEMNAPLFCLRPRPAAEYLFSHFCGPILMLAWLSAAKSMERARCGIYVHQDDLLPLTNLSRRGAASIGRSCSDWYARELNDDDAPPCHQWVSRIERRRRCVLIGKIIPRADACCSPTRLLPGAITSACSLHSGHWLPARWYPVIRWQCCYPGPFIDGLNHRHLATASMVARRPAVTRPRQGAAYIRRIISALGDNEYFT